MRTNTPRLGFSVALVVMSVQVGSAQTTNDPLLSALQTVAALPRAPSIVAAAGLTRANERLLTLEHAGSVGDPERRLVIVGGLDRTSESAQAVLEALRWFKSDAPAALRRTWTITALPCVHPRRCSPGTSGGGPESSGDLAFPPEGGTCGAG